NHYDECDDDVADRRRINSAAEPQLRNEVVARERAADDRAEGICRVEIADALAEMALVPDENLAQHRECRAHEKGRHGEQEKRENEKDDIESAGRELVEPEERRVNSARRVEQRRRDESVNADAEFQRSVQPEQVCSPIREPAEDVAAERETGHEGGEHGRDGVGGAAENLCQHPHPDDLVYQRGGAGKEEADKQRRDHRGMAAVSGVARARATRSPRRSREAAASSRESASLSNRARRE